MSIKLVLDTHVVLEWLLWQSPRHAWLFGALAKQEVCLIHDAHTLKEWQQVLSYPIFALDDATQRALIERYQSLSTIAVTDAIDEPVLPKCKDPNDQKFLRLAFLAQAKALLTRDKKLLKIGKHKLFRTTFATMTPEAWLLLPAALPLGQSPNLSNSTFA